MPDTQPDHLALHHTRKDEEGNAVMVASAGEPLETAGGVKEPVAEHEESLRADNDKVGGGGA